MSQSTMADSLPAGIEAEAVAQPPTPACTAALPETAVRHTGRA
ncbi:hypothetical protein [Roseomonas gilardii]|nr:hypothetical protein [Roseomonas gilardii]